MILQGPSCKGDGANLMCISEVSFLHLVHVLIFQGACYLPVDVGDKSFTSTMYLFISWTRLHVGMTVHSVCQKHDSKMFALENL